MDVPDFPILGSEPVAVELANTLYGSGARQVDFLRSPEWIDLWFSLVGAEHGLMVTAGLGRDAPRVRELRDCVRHLLSAAAGARAPDPRMVDLLNEYATVVPTHPRLEWATDGTRLRRNVDLATGDAAVLGRIAADCIAVLTAPPARSPRRCTGPGCSMLYVKNHSRRRWCHPSCGHRDRQARYHRRRHASGTP
ncbi:CGNR zinc finger domain-containing protein [Thermomonospora umbrina]|uniref:Putative RNA-binding Zn ribbon-like protein n=1 Tax=Thermomonospora umbrina TaxID=111806 RepID=A0A3D9SFP1_9ACTN|nr:CGNR zinc finger domain-containing protein [Thermomonospora umbrina]REE94758.1 putative RNA-binding Zn ribbon-like protein [Thermomonospora umbrina]